jgi:signal transduction histidine kinase
MMAEGRDLETARQIASRAQRLHGIATGLLADLERLTLAEAGALAAHSPAGTLTPPASPKVALVAWIQNGRVVLPWDVAPFRTRFARLFDDRAFADALAEGERDEAAERYPFARAAFDRARARTHDPDRTTYATLLLARALVKCNCRDEAVPDYERLLTADLVDDQGVPIALYAAQQLTHAHHDWHAVLRMLDRRPVTPLTPPAAAYLTRDLLTSARTDARTAADRQDASRQLAATAEALTAIERALHLQRDWPALAAAAPDQGGGPWWMPFDDERWLVSAAPSLAGLPPLLVAVRTDAVLARTPTPASGSAASAAPRLPVLDDAGEPLGPAFPGLRVRVDDSADEIRAWSHQRALFMLSLGAVMIVALCCGVLFWRDVTRQLHMAELRAQFVASVSHELRTPLTAIRMFAETLELDRPLGLSARREYLETIVSESERLTRLVNNVLDFSRIERGEKVYHPQPVALARVLDDAARAMRYPLSRHGFELTIDMPDDLPAVRVDPDAIEQAVLNLLSNAMKYSGTARQVALHVTTGVREVVIAVSDRGLGVPASEQTRIFERFYRVPTPDNARIPGTGLGLALVDHIVKGHGGRVEVTSAPGRGSTFAIHLPLEMECPA